jgi:hypothetical protein
MKKTKFSYKYTDKHDGEKIKATVKVMKSDLTKDLGHTFVFIDTIHVESTRTVSQEISLPIKAVKKLIKALQKVCK